MPEKETIERARKDKREGKAPSTQAGEFVRETIDHIREGKHGARSTKQAIAIGLSKARRAGVKLPPPKKGTVSEKTRRSAELASREGQSGVAHKVNPRRSRAISKALQREGHGAASPEALGRQASQQARKRTPQERMRHSAESRQNAARASDSARTECDRSKGCAYADGNALAMSVSKG